MADAPPSETTNPWEKFGPLLPKNPQLADLLISRALEKKYGKKIELEKLDDSEEQEANSYIFHRFVKNEG